MNREAFHQVTGEKRLVDYLRHHYERQLTSVKSLRGALKLKTDQGQFLLKKVTATDKERWRLVEELSHALQERFSIPAPVRTQSGELTFDGFRHRYVLLPWIQGTEISLRKTRDWGSMSRRLAQLHQASKTFKPKHAYRKFQRVGKWLGNWKNAYRQLELFQIAAKLTRQPTETDESWIEVAGYSMSVMENLLKYFEMIDGTQVIKATSKEGKVCHGSLHRHNVLVDEQRQIHFIDWNQAALDVRTTDLAQLLLYAYHRTQSPEVMATILREYQQIAKLREEEFALIYARFLFPQRLIRVLQRVYADQTLPITAGAPSIYSAAKREEAKIGLVKCYVQMLQNEFDLTIPQIAWLNR